MAGGDARTFPLVARRPIAGTPFGAVRSPRRGPGLDLAGLRPYRPGDDFRLIDRYASARASAAAASDELVVREYLTEEATQVWILVDGSPTMALYPDGMPWLSKPRAVDAAVRVIEESAQRAGCPLELRSDGGGLEEQLAALVSRDRRPKPGSFVFALSDFLQAPSARAVQRALECRIDLVPVLIQDPTWEQSFPPIAGVVVPLADPASGRFSHVLLRAADAEERRRANEQRLAAIRRGFDALGLDHVLLSTSDPDAIAQAFLAWSIARQTGGRLR